MTIRIRFSFVVADTFSELAEFLPNVVIERGLLFGILGAHIEVKLLFLVSIRSINGVDIHDPIDIR